VARERSGRLSRKAHEHDPDTVVLAGDVALVVVVFLESSEPGA
jgi:hypothetical protein